MRLLDRYTLRELLTPLGFCLCGFLVFWVSFDLLTELRDLQAHKLQAIDVLQYYAVRAPEFVVTVLPMALLLAVLYALGRHAKHNELTAMRCAGLGMWRICTPHLAVGVLASLVSFAMNELWVPDTEQRAELVLKKRLADAPGGMRDTLVRNFGFTNARQRRTWQFAIYNPLTTEMTEPKVDWERPDGSYIELIAKRAVWTNGMWTFYEVWQNVYLVGGDRSAVPQHRNFFDALPVPAFSETPRQINSQVKIATRLSRRAGKRADVPLAELWSYLQLRPELTPQDHAWLYTKLHGRLAAPWACLVAVLIAIPFGAGLGARNVYVGAASSVGLCFGYFVLMQLGLALGSGGHLPPAWGAWLPNIVFGLLGFVLIVRAR
ncbi:MAG: LptF/LptG family permease [Verrucomicrobiae bacterium]|nr:LptF/LptG family permease [Verrucomicrobiae bacterium]